MVVADGDDVPARVADDLFWLGRYAERTDGTARLLREVLLRSLGSERCARRRAAAAAARGDRRHRNPSGLRRRGRAAAPALAGARAAAALLLDRRRPGSLRYDIEALVRAGRSVRDRLSSDTSRVINSLDRELARPTELGAALESLQRVIFLLAAFAGLCEREHEPGPGLALPGDRPLPGARRPNAVACCAAVPVRRARRSAAGLEALLGVAHSVKTYRRRYRSRMHFGAVLDLLLLDESEPALGGVSAARGCRA